MIQRQTITMSDIKVERRLAYDLSAANISKITVHTEGAVGDRVYLVELWDWKVLFQPSVDYPFKPPKARYLRPESGPGSDEWKQYNAFFETTTAQLTLEQLAMSIICDLSQPEIDPVSSQ